VLVHEQREFGGKADVGNRDAGSHQRLPPRRQCLLDPRGIDRERILGARNDPREVIADPHAKYFGTELSERSLVPDNDAQLGETHFEDWVSRSTSQVRATTLQRATAASQKQ